MATPQTGREMGVLFDVKLDTVASTQPDTNQQDGWVPPDLQCLMIIGMFAGPVYWSTDQWDPEFSQIKDPFNLRSWSHQHLAHLLFQIGTNRSQTNH